MKRLFFAIDLIDNIKNEIYSYCYQQNQNNNISFVRKENLHITLRFLGNVEADKLNLILNQLRDKFHHFNNFEISIGNLYILSKRIICFPVKSVENRLDKIFFILEKNLHTLGFKKEKRNFKPHITVGRIKNSRLFNFNKNNFENIQLENNFFLSTGVSLISSILKPKGPIYSQIKHFPFKEFRR